MRKILLEVAWKKVEDILQNLKQLQKTREEKESGSLLLRAKPYMKGALFSGASSPHSFPASHKGTVSSLQVKDLTPVRRGVLQGKHAVKAGVENPAAPAPASKKQQGTAHPDVAPVQDYATVSSKSERLVRSHLPRRKLTLCFDTIKEEETSDITLLPGKRKLETIFRFHLLCSLGSRIFIKLG